jgi:hypothetical protein
MRIITLTLSLLVLLEFVIRITVAIVDWDKMLTYLTKCSGGNIHEHFGGKRK